MSKMEDRHERARRWKGMSSRFLSQTCSCPPRTLADNRLCEMFVNRSGFLHMDEYPIVWLGRVKGEEADSATSSFAPAIIELF